MDRPTVTLCMIVKDETHIIEQCLRSMAKYVDRYDITDTGSTDGTQDLIKKIMDELGVSGTVHQSDWKGFGDVGDKMGSRTESFRNAEKSGCDYAWVIDADDYMEGNFKYPDNFGSADAYALGMGRGEFTWWRNQIFKLSEGWKYVGVLHEYATTDKPREEMVYDRVDNSNYKLVARTEGNRNVGISIIEKYTKDAETILEAMKVEPDNTRYMFYLAQSYFDSQQWDKAMEWYGKRAEAGGWPEEIYYSRLRIGILCGILNKPHAEFEAAMLDCWNGKPDRAEPLWFLARHHRMNGKPALGYIYARIASEIPYPKNDILFVHGDVYNWAVLDELAATSYYAMKPHVGYNAAKVLLESNAVPPEHRTRVADNFKSYSELLQHIHGQEEANRMKEETNKKAEKAKRVNRIKKSTKAPAKTKYKKKAKA